MRVGEPTGRWRVGYTTVMGVSWADFHSKQEALHFMRRQRRGGAIDVRLLREYESDDRFAADFRRVSA